MSASSSSATDPDPLVALARVHKRYGRRDVLRDITFDLRRGDTVLIVGGNGSGKSTLLRMVAGIAPATAGTRTASPAFRAMRTCYVPQTGGLYADLTVAENLRALAYLTGARMPADIGGAAPIDALGITPYLHLKAAELSGGFQKLAAIACALAVLPQCIFLDEPIAGIDPERTKLLTDGLAALIDGLDLVVITDHLNRMPVAKKVIRIHEGAIQ